MDEREKINDLKCIKEYYDLNQNYRTYEIVVNQSIIICNYADKFTYWKQNYSRENGTYMK